MKEQIQARITEIEQALAGLVQQHGALIGRLEEAKHMLTMAEEVVTAVEPIVEACEG